LTRLPEAICDGILAIVKVALLNEYLQYQEFHHGEGLVIALACGQTEFLVN
jgi:hypothetical protein